MRTLVARRWLWALWGLAAAVSTATVVLLLIDFSDLSTIVNDGGVTGVKRSELNPALAGTLVSSVLVIILSAVSFFVILRATTWAAGTRAPGRTSVPFAAASYLFTALFLVLTGIVLIATGQWKDRLELGGWSAGNTAVLTAAYWLSFICAGFYIVMSVALLFLQRALRSDSWMSAEDRELGLAQGLRGGTRSSTSTAPPSDYAESVAAAKKNYSGAWGRP